MNPTDEDSFRRLRAQRQQRRKAMLGSAIALAIIFAGDGIIRGDYIGTPLFGALGCCAGFTWMKIAPLVYRKRSASRRRASGAIYADLAFLDDVERLRHVPAGEQSLGRLRWPWWSYGGLRTLGALPGVLWIVSDDRGTKLGWVPGWMARRCRARSWWLSADDVAHLALCEFTVLVRLRDGTELSLRANREGLGEALAKVAPSEPADQA